ncbi:hypothetical protein DFR24_2522 [Panacagrimonas perspica]|uniref:Uncharacterized protein n=1 Tax=Panacagrimonas perspica TaxID=381431 RepID=A0A4R7P3D4_9GAMM|nr:hypothetical protein [Panacagrimonas perspica]TDU28157.1 hypothetical protein DFR24_2522 [Panacagrimonas perspica]THD00654.1 hypothetical protein B1810_23915 [Panacagrimonas perspica]
MNTRILVAALLILVGTLQMAGDLFGSTALRALGAATAASPAPKVFTRQGDVETFSARFFVEWTDRSGRRVTTALTPENYGHLRGPYNRRNTFGAAVAGAPMLRANPMTRALYESVSSYALCGDAPLLREMGLDPDPRGPAPVLRIEPRVPVAGESRPQPLVFEMCSHA